jgi:hypothetical protein
MMPEELRRPATPLRRDPAALLRRTIQNMAGIRKEKEIQRGSGENFRIQT